MDELKRPRRPPCADNPERWDLDVGTSTQWRESVRICGRCTLLAACARRAAALVAEGSAPKGMIWAGVGYDSTGNAVANLESYRSSPPSSHGRPMLITRVGPRPPTPDAEQAGEFQQPLVRRTRRIVMGKCSTADGSRVEHAS
ncbi:hypothetical protein [Nocardia asiatica]|uniref:hypothetical protein n=1 Tax=Nocardia asiatica TaxID=209252 RepID=UPI003EDED9AE